MKKEPIMVVLLLIVLIIFSCYLIINGYRTKEVSNLNGNIKISRDEQPILFWLQMVFLTFFPLFLTAILAFVILHYFIGII